MLKEIWSERFKNHDSPEKAVQLKTGLNIVIGYTETGDESGNSLGKSTFLHMIDYIFGGDSFLKTKSFKNAGEHKIYYMFEFSGKQYRFCRTVSKKSVVYKCKLDYSYSETDKYESLDEYKKFLAAMYKLDISELSFREWISPFFKIFNKSPNIKDHPLMNSNSSSEQAEIHSLEKMFGRYSEIKDMVEVTLKKKNITDVKKYASKRNIELKELAYISNPKDTVKEIELLESKKQKLLEEQNAYIKELDAKTSIRLAEIDSQLSLLRRKRNKINSQISNLKKEISREAAPSVESFELLKQFFPDVNLRKIEEIEKFHSSLSEILKIEYRDKIEELTKLLLPVDELVRDLQNEFYSLTGNKDFKTSFLQEYARIQYEINTKKEELEKYYENQRIANAAKEAKPILIPKEKEILNDIAGIINPVLTDFSRKILGENYNKIQLSFDDTSKYSVSVTTDDGTSTTYLGPIAFDLSVLKLSSLPVVAHDSYLFSDTKGKRFDSLMIYYDSLNSLSQKQIFISVHQRKSPNEFSERTNKIINDNRILALKENGGELYGENWSITKGN
ncbi:MAG: DUF2326 domain-containing protein [Treponema sp.]|nr:DUF2326 domain-containing protein [Treponema sp.]